MFFIFHGSGKNHLLENRVEREETPGFSPENIEHLEGQGGRPSKAALLSLICQQGRRREYRQEYGHEFTVLLKGQ